MNKTIFITVLCLFFGCRAFNQPKNSKDEPKIYIIFIEKFQNDTVSVWLNGCQIVKDEVITNSIYGLTDLRMVVSNPNKILLREDSIELPCNLNFKSNINLTVSLNGKKNTFKIDLTKGYYIGIDKGNKLFFIQNKLPFEFD